MVPTSRLALAPRLRSALASMVPTALGAMPRLRSAIQSMFRARRHAALAIGTSPMVPTRRAWR